MKLGCRGYPVLESLDSGMAVLLVALTEQSWAALRTAVLRVVNSDVEVSRLDSTKYGPVSRCLRNYLHAALGQSLRDILSNILTGLHNWD